MTRTIVLAVLVIASVSLVSASETPTTTQSEKRTRSASVASTSRSLSSTGEKSASAEELLRAHVEARFVADMTAMQTLRPGYAFWQHIFTIPDGAIAYGSGVDGRLLAVFPAAGDWVRDSTYKDPAVAAIVARAALPARLVDRRDAVAERFEAAIGPVLHNATRGEFFLPNVQRYGGFVNEWGAIYERFGVPAEIGIAQAIVESGLSGAVRSEARAIGFCQWLLPNWNHLKRLAPNPIEGYNQTTQARYCAAYLTILATKYGTFIAALSDHHAGGTNVGRTLINGLRLGARDVRERYFFGSELARDLRLMAPGSYTDVYGSYGPRSFRYSEMVFGNTYNVRRLRMTVTQTQIYAMRAPRVLTIKEITSRSGLSADEVRRFNQALVRAVPAGADVYLPKYVQALGPDVSFWHRPPGGAYATVLNQFVRLDLPVDAWDSPAIVPILRDFRGRFHQTKTEEGAVMATVLAYVLDDIQTSGRATILADFRSSPQVLTVFDRAVLEREGYRRTRSVLDNHSQLAELAQPAVPISR